MLAQDSSPDDPVTCKETRYRKRKRTPSIEDFVARDKKDAYQAWSDDDYTEDSDEDNESASTSSSSSSGASNKQQDSEDYDSDTVGDKELAALGVKRAKTHVDLEAAFTALDSEDGAECQAASKHSNQKQDGMNKAKAGYDAGVSVDDFPDIPVQADLAPNTAPEPQRSSRPHKKKRRRIDEDDDEVFTEADELRLALIKSEREIAEKEADGDAKEEENDDDSLFVQD